MAAEMIEIVNQRFEARQAQLKQQRDLDELFAIGNRPGIERRQREAAKRKQDQEWGKIKNTFFHCLQLITFALLVADALMLMAVLIISWKGGIWG